MSQNRRVLTDAERHQAQDIAADWGARNLHEPANRAASFDAWKRAMITGPHTHPADLGVIAAALTDPETHDAIFASLIPGIEPALVTRLLRGRPRPGDAGVPIAILVSPSTGVRPGKAARAARFVLDAVAATAAEHHQANPLALLGRLAWWDDEPKLAADLTDMALAVDPNHLVARSTRGFLMYRMAPGWKARTSR